MMSRHRVAKALVACLLAWAAGDSLLLGDEVYLRTGVITNMMPDGSNVVMWGFARDTSFGAGDGTIAVPGPLLEVRPDDPTLTVHLDNRLPVPVSVVIPGQISADAPVPARAPDGRATSFTHETAPGNVTPGDYTWNNLRPGSFLYESGSHPAIQVQMGLYGALKKDAGFGEPYPGVRDNGEVTLLYSEIDPALHDAVAADDFGDGKTMTSTVNYAAKYFLINGQSYTNGLLPVHTGRPGDTILLRFLNAGLQTHVPIVNDAYVRLVAEDGFAYPYPKDQYSVFLPAGKTIDALFLSSASNTLALYDRRLDMMNGAASPGGMLAYLEVSKPASETVPPLWWLQQYFGGGPYPPDLMPAYIAGLDPTNPASELRFTEIDTLPGNSTAKVFFASTTTNRFYNLLSTTNVVTGPWTLVYSNVPGAVGSMYWIVPEATGTHAFFRVSVELP